MYLDLVALAVNTDRGRNNLTKKIQNLFKNFIKNSKS